MTLKHRAALLPQTTRYEGRTNSQSPSMSRSDCPLSTSTEAPTSPSPQSSPLAPHCAQVAIPLHSPYPVGSVPPQVTPPSENTTPQATHTTTTATAAAHSDTSTHAPHMSQEQPPTAPTTTTASSHASHYSPYSHSQGRVQTSQATAETARVTPSTKASAKRASSSPTNCSPVGGSTKTVSESAHHASE